MYSGRQWKTRSAAVFLNALLWIRTPRLRKMVAKVTALRREWALQRTLFHLK